jgi:type I restriction enzyme S subunit
MQTKNKPTLRFKNFKEDWGVQKLDDLTDKISDGIHTTPNYSENGEFYFINGNNLSNGKILLNESTKRVDEEEFNKLKVHLNSNTILLSINGTIGNIAFFNGEQVVLGKSAAYLNLKANHNKYFAFYSLQSPSVKSFFNSELTGSTIMNLSLATIKKTIIGFPSLPEQTKIATFLSAIDEKIERQQRLLTLWQAYKKGIMQQIFSQKLRFKAPNDGILFPKWQKQRLGDFLIKHDEKNTINNQYPILTSSRLGILLQSEYYNGNEVASSNNIGYNVVPRGYFTYRHMSDDLIFKFNRNTIVDKGIVSTLYPVFTTKKELDSTFLQYILNEGSEFKKFCVDQKQGGSRTYLYYSKLVDLKLTLPSYEEQTKIANFLSSLDDKIAHIQRQLTSFREFKKGLLQQMFV